MRATITCTACGTVLGIPKSGMPADGLPCNWCGYVNLKAPEPAPKPVAAAVRAPEMLPVASAPVATPHPFADDQDDNGQPYEMPPEEVKTRACEDCGKLIDLNSVVCVHCGYDVRAKGKAERTYSLIDREWESGWPFHRRMAVFLAFQAMNVATLAMSFAAGGSIPVSLTGIVIYVILQAFLLGTYESFRIRRNKRGQVELTLQWRLGFIPMGPKKVNWREHEGVVFGHYDPTGLVDWWIAIVLLPFCIIPAILWWWFVIRSDRFFAALARDRGYPATYLYRGMNEIQAREITQVTSDATALPLVRPL